MRNTIECGRSPSILVHKTASCNRSKTELMSEVKDLDSLATAGEARNGQLRAKNIK